MSPRRYAWFDLTANLTFYGPGPGGRGQGFSHSVPLLKHYRQVTRQRAVLPDLAALTWSAVQVGVIAVSLFVNFLCFITVCASTGRRRGRAGCSFLCMTASQTAMHYQEMTLSPRICKHIHLCLSSLCLCLTLPAVLPHTFSRTASHFQPYCLTHSATPPPAILPTLSFAAPGVAAAAPCPTGLLKAVGCAADLHAAGIDPPHRTRRPSRRGRAACCTAGHRGAAWSECERGGADCAIL